MTSFFRRTLTGIGIVVFSLGAVLLGPYSFFMFCLLICLLGLWEFYRLLEITNNRVRSVAGLILAASLLFTVFLFAVLHRDWKVLLVNLPLISFIFCTVLFIGSGNPFQELAIVFLGQAYITLPFMLLSVIGFALDRTTFSHHIVLGYFFYYGRMTPGPIYWDRFSAGRRWHLLFHQRRPGKGVPEEYCLPR